MSNNINAVIKQRTDTIENWVIKNPPIHENEQIIVKLSEDKIGIKIGIGKTFNETPFISFESLNVNLLNNDGYNLSLPKENGTLATLLPLYSNLQVIKPFCEYYSHIKVIVSNNPEFSNILFELDSKIDRAFKAFDANKWHEIDLDGFGLEYNNKPVLINLRNKLIGSKYNLTTSTILYINYYWYHEVDGVNVNSDIYSSILPSGTEVGANSQDVVSKSELDNILSIKLSELCSSNITSIQLIKPYSLNTSHIHLEASVNSEFDELLFSMNSSTDSYDMKYWSSFESKWLTPDNGFDVSCNNLPILIDFSSKLNSEYSKLYIRYYWYNNINGDIVKSDTYSMALPSYTEVGANSQDVLTKSELGDVNISDLMTKVEDLQDRVNNLDIDGKSFSEAVLDVINSNYENAENTLY